MSKTQHRIRYRTFLKWTLLAAGPAPLPSAPPSDAGDNPPWNSDDERDFAENFSSGSHKCKPPPTVQPVPYWTDGRQGLTYRGFTGVLQHI